MRTHERTRVGTAVIGRSLLYELRSIECIPRESPQDLSVDEVERDEYDNR